MSKSSNRRGILGAAGVLSAALAVVAGAGALAGLGDSASGATRAAPVNTSRPTIKGVAREGSTLSGTPGTWKGSQPMQFSAQWRRCDSSGANCGKISGAINPTYTPTMSDLGHRIRLTVTASNSQGSSAATSAATIVIQQAAANAPSNTSAPTIGGRAQEGQTLTGNRGEWNGTQPISFDYQWQRCDSKGNFCASISGAQGQAYVLTSADVNNTVRLRVTATNQAGRTTAYSRASAVVFKNQAPPPPPPSGPPGAIKLPSGETSIPVTSVSVPQRLVIGRIEFSPNPLRSRDDLITARFRITDTRNYVVRGALVFVTPLPYGWTSQPAETVSGTDGWATVTMRATSALPRRAAVVMFVRARKAGDFVLTGVSNRRLVQMLVSLS